MRKIAILVCAIVAPSLAIAQSKPEVSEARRNTYAAQAKEAKALAVAHEKQLSEEKAKFTPIAEAEVKGMRAAGVNVDALLAATKEFVSRPPGKANGMAEEINRKYAAEIRKGLTAAFRVPEIGALLQQGTHQDPPPPPPPPPPCCEKKEFPPPFTGLGSEGNLFSASVTPFISVTQLHPIVGGGGAFASHDAETSGLDITVPSTACHVRVDFNLDTSWDIKLGGVGYAHIWIGLDANVTAPDGTTVCRSPHLEQDNQTGVFGATESNHEPGPHVVLSCEFNRSASGPVHFIANVRASADGTFFGAAGGSGDYSVTLGPVDVTSCPCQ